MQEKIDKSSISKSVIAVPPLARNDDYSLNPTANREMIRYLEAGRVKTILYGGNANFYHIRISEYADLLSMLQDSVASDTWIIPSVGPAYGTMMDQAKIVGSFDFPTVMVLPHRELATPAGIATAVRQFVEAAGVPIGFSVSPRADSPTTCGESTCESLTRSSGGPDRTATSNARTA